MGWGKIRRTVRKVADPLRITNRIDNLKIVKNIKSEGTKAVAQYGAIAGTVAQVVPGIGTAVGAGLIAGSVAANIKLKQEAAKKQQRANAADAAMWAAEDAESLRANAPDGPNQANFYPSVPNGAISSPLDEPKPRDRGTYISGAGNLLNNLFPAPTREQATGAAPGASQFAPTATSREIMTGSAESSGSFFSRYRTGIMIAAAVAVGLVVVVIAVKR